MSSEQLARSLLPPVSAGTRRSGYPVAPSPAVVDRVLLAVAALSSLAALWQLWFLLTMGL